jgi:hypothetical protein
MPTEKEKRENLKLLLQKSLEDWELTGFRNRLAAVSEMLDSDKDEKVNPINLRLRDMVKAASIKSLDYMPHGKDMVRRILASVEKIDRDEKDSSSKIQKGLKT